ncbi:hypothetical protein CY35_02G180800 [Sphagnum magellanicum]|jgi:hypothetical protein|nr:hypothetical protein CY35_02G180800 [Sphagnum magellanicum]
MKTSVVLLFFFLGLTSRYVSSFKSDELPEDDEEWGFVGRETGSTFGGGRGERVAQGSSSNEGDKRRSGSTTAAPTSPAVDASGDKKIQFDLEHSFGDSEFTPAGSFSARLRASTHGRQTLSKLRLTRNPFSEFQENAFKELVQQDGFYKVRIPANVIDPGKTYVMASIKARCLAAASLKERFDLNLDQGNVIGITYSSGADCTYPRPQVFPSDWTFNSWIVSKSSEQATRVIPMFEDTPLENLVTGEDGLPTKVVEKNFWQKYWMYIIPFGLILVNAITSIANMPEEPAGGQGAAPAGAVPQRIAGAGGARRR